MLSQFDNTLYDGAGNLTQVVRQVAAASASPYSDTLQFQYNAKDELTQEKFLNNGGSPYVYNFAFDNAGNPTTFRGSARTYNANNQLTGPSSYAYDGNGNPMTYRGGSLTYDAGDNPTSISLGTGITAGYTSEGVRAWKQAGTVRTYFLYDGTDPVVEMNASGGTVAVNTFGLAGLVSRHYPSMFGANNSVFYTFDETGNVSQRFDGMGTLLSTHGFQAYGQYGSTSANPDPWGYKARSGYYTDQETGLVLCTFRYYDPANGRWINRDPIGYAGGLNLYAYCGGNPVMGTDPSGLINKLLEDRMAGGGGYVSSGGSSSISSGSVGSGSCGVGAGGTIVAGALTGSGGGAAKGLEKAVDVAIMAKTAYDLYAFGNASGPKGARIDKDIFPDKDGMVHLTEPITGASLFGDPMHPALAGKISGPYYRLPAGSLIPQGYRIVADGIDVPGGTLDPTHHTFFTTQSVKATGFQEAFLGLNWDRKEDGTYKEAGRRKQGQ